MKTRAANVLVFIHHWEHDPEPDEWFDNWLASYHPEDTQFIYWAILSWGEVRTWNATERAEQKAIVGNLLESLP